MHFYLSIATIRRIILLVVLLGLLVIAFGIYRLVSAQNRYDELAAIAPPSLEELQSLKPGDPLLMSLAALDRDKRDLLSQEGQAKSIIGLGAVIIGIAVVIFLRVLEQNASHA